MAAGLWTLLLVTLCPTIHWLDTAALTASSWQLATAHPPGEPAWILVTRSFLMLPLGSIGFRAGLSSAASTLLAGCFAWKLLEAASRRSPMPSGHLAAPLLAGAIASSPVLTQAVRPEVYALQLALALGTLWLSLGGGLLGGAFDLRRHWVSALLTGLNFAVHPLLGLLSALPLAIGWLAHRGLRTAKALSGGLAAFGLGFSCYLFLAIRAAARPDQGWDVPSRLEPFLDVLLARTFARNFSPLTLPTFLHNLEAVADVLTEGTGPGILLLAAVGIASLIHRGRWRLAGLLGGCIGTVSWAILPQNKVFTENPDLHGYLALPVILLWMLAGLGLNEASTKAGGFPRVRFGLAGLAWLLAMRMAFISLPENTLGQSYDARELGKKGFEGLAPGSSVIVSGNDATFILHYLRVVEGVRPEVDLLLRPLLTHAWYRQRLSRPERELRMAYDNAVAYADLGHLPLRVEARERDFTYALRLWPAPASGWGFYDVLPAAVHAQDMSCRPEKAAKEAVPAFAYTRLVQQNILQYSQEYLQAASRPPCPGELSSALGRPLP